MARPKKKPTADVRKHRSGAVIAHIDTKDSRVVALGNLRVLITKEDGSWIAQGLEIDYAIDGDTVPEVKRRFETGLAMTIESHLRVHNSIDHLLKIAPYEIWSDYFASKNTIHRFQHSQVSIHPSLQKHLPFERIDYYEPDAEKGDHTATVKRNGTTATVKRRMA
jgi:hypothetical protein